MATDESSSVTDRTTAARRLVPVTPAVFHILLALVAGDRHGYGIKLDVRRLTRERIDLGSGTLYRSLQKMMMDGLVEKIEEGETATPAAGEDERRLEYRLTPLGRRVAELEAERLADLVEVAMESGLLPARPARRADGRRARLRGDRA